MDQMQSAPHSRQITMPALHHSVFYRPDALPAAQPTASDHWRQTTAHVCSFLAKLWSQLQQIKRVTKLACILSKRVNCILWADNRVQAVSTQCNDFHTFQNFWVQLYQTNTNQHFTCSHQHYCLLMEKWQSKYTSLIINAINDFLFSCKCKQ